MKNLLMLLLIFSSSMITAQVKSHKKIKHQFYMSVGQYINSPVMMTAEIGNKFYFNRSFDRNIHFGLDVSYVSAKLTGHEPMVFEITEESGMAAGMKIGPNLALRIIKGIFIEANYRINPEAIADASLEDIGFNINHYAGANVRIGPLMIRGEYQLSPNNRGGITSYSTSRPLILSLCSLMKN